MKAQIRNNTYDAKEVGGKFYAWIPRQGKWSRVAKTKIVKG